MKPFPGLLHRFRAQVDAKDEAAGRELHRYRRVRLLVADRDRLAAEVRVGESGRRQEVRLSWARARDEKVVDATCGCAAARGGRLCRHVWAVLIDYEERDGHIPGREPLRVEFSTAELPWPDISRRPTYDSGMRPQLYDRRAGVRGDDDASGDWKGDVGAVRRRLAPPQRTLEVRYRLDAVTSESHGRLYVDVCQKAVLKDGRLGSTKPLKISEDEAAKLPDPADREILGLLLATASTQDVAKRYAPERRRQRGFSRGTVPSLAYASALPLLCSTGRFAWVREDYIRTEKVDLRWDERPWRFVLLVERRPELGQGRVGGVLERGDGEDRERRPLEDADLALSNGLVLVDGVFSPLEVGDGAAWLERLRAGRGDVLLGAGELPELVDALRGLPALPALDLPEDLDFERARVVPVPGLRLRTPDRGRRDVLFLDVFFQYAGTRLDAWAPPAAVVDGAGRVVARDTLAEQAALAKLAEMSGVRARGKTPGQLRLRTPSFYGVVARLLRDGWIVEAEGRRVRPPSRASWSIRSDVDWFELRVSVDFEGQGLAAPDLLRAVGKGEHLVRLGDGSEGMLPEKWLRLYGPVAQLAPPKDGRVPLRGAQAVLIAELLEAAGDRLQVDERFGELRRRVRAGERPVPRDAPEGFRGELRTYQREGLGWLTFLREVGMGGCLADDMGLGKTVQVLALLAACHARGGGPPSMVVAPRSLVYNWLAEARRFTPRLRVLSYLDLTPTERTFERLPALLASHDVVVTTYGLLRRDSYVLQDVDLAYLVLDEAQAIKNPGSQAAWSSRHLEARYRLAVTGTPVENHLGELWSLFEFLNPGLLGAMRPFYRLGSRPDGLERIVRALRPFLLRRTKEEVLEELPPKTEQTLFCDLEEEDESLYVRLRDHYRERLRQRIADVGLGGSKLQVLEALLRLRQAACHPGLVDEERAGAASPKLLLLFEQLGEVLAEGHKALVFSQFVRLLAFVRAELERRGVPYEYLDGGTRDREERVERFQSEEGCKVFLISLKAGGVGLNLTAADYVFLLDPWWNPAVEAQAVDRVHRIGQTRPVFAYRLVTRGTVEEKILALQESKRELAEALLGGSAGGVQDLTAEDVESLFS